MTGRLAPCFDILPPAQQRLWPELKSALDLGFVLYGGTALALRLGHRPSIDFDFFTEKTLDRKLIAQSFLFLSQSLVLQDEPNTLTILVPYLDADHAGVKVSFFGDGDLATLTTAEKNVLFTAVKAVGEIPNVTILSKVLRA